MVLGYLIIVIIVVFYILILINFIRFLQEKLGKRKTPSLKLVKPILISLLPIFCFIMLINYVNIFNYEKPIPYKNINKISFENFRGLEFFRKSLYGSTKFAYIVTNIKIEIEDEYIEIETFFHPSKSYVYNDQINNDELLTHELYHFHITELFARKLKKEIKDNNIRDISGLNKVIDKFQALENDFQKSYDNDTFHSYVLKEQIKYQKEVDSLLYSLKDFENSKLLLDVKN